MSVIDPSDKEFAATVVSIQRDLVEEGGVMSSEEADLTGEADIGYVEVGANPTCCQFANGIPSVGSATFNSSLGAKLTDEFRK